MSPCVTRLCPVSPGVAGKKGKRKDRQEKKEGERQEAGWFPADEVGENFSCEDSSVGPLGSMQIPGERGPAACWQGTHTTWLQPAAASRSQCRLRQVCHARCPDPLASTSKDHLSPSEGIPGLHLHGSKTASSPAKCRGISNPLVSRDTRLLTSAVLVRRARSLALDSVSSVQKELHLLVQSNAAEVREKASRLLVGQCLYPVTKFEFCEFIFKGSSNF